MKLLAIVFTLMFSISALASVWSTQKVSKTYKLKNEIKLTYIDEEITIKKGTLLELVEVSELTMIKVHLHKFRLDKCSYRNIETDLELINVKQPNSSTTSVGVNLSRGCKVEVFIDMDEYNTHSFFE